MNINKIIADELSVKLSQIDAAVKLLDEGSTVPFVARYRKEATGGLSDTELRNLQERLVYLRELEERKETVLASIEKQGKLTTELKKSIIYTDNKSRLEDLYLPYKPKRRTKAQIAKEVGLEPLALSLLLNPNLDPEFEAKKYLNEECNIVDVATALDGANQILMEKFSEDADLVTLLRDYLFDHGVLQSKVLKGKEESGAKFKDYFAFNEPIKKIPSHRALAIFRGRKEGVLSASLGLERERDNDFCLQKIANRFSIQKRNRNADNWLWECVVWTWKIKLQLKIETDLLLALRERSEIEAIKVFRENLKNLLMAAPAGRFVTMGLDPGLRTGVKAVVVDDTGKLLEYITIFPHAPKNEWDRSLHVLRELIAKYQVKLMSIGNGTASRETERLVDELMRSNEDGGLTKAVVSEAGASVYSASEVAAHEFPDLDVSYRGAVSIARRLQDPLAELVKIDPKAIGVGQYQHDVNQMKLSQGLDAVVEDCVNSVGADVNTASVPLLSSIAGLNEGIAKNIVSYREEHGRFLERRDLKKVPRLGDKSFEQAVGFLRIMGGNNPLDASAVHPEAYSVVENMLQILKKPIGDVMGNASLLKELKPQDFIDKKFGLPTIKDILAELQKPGRDPRPTFKTAEFKDGIETIKDLKVGMQLEGVVTNVTNFGAFVDVGVHQDGLVHISQMANRYVADPHEIVKVGNIVQVKVVEVDLPRNRIQLTMKA
ncbi:MAG: RNA-binding transcriptional accessory protein [Gammaproteobacteria bacterium]|nr:RNA-binding transcriptional accessory protein [Gammaproteobacteria bacterium]